MTGGRGRVGGGDESGAGPRPGRLPRHAFRVTSRPDVMRSPASWVEKPLIRRRAPDRRVTRRLRTVSRARTPTSRPPAPLPSTALREDPVVVSTDADSCPRGSDPSDSRGEAESRSRAKPKPGLGRSRPTSGLGSPRVAGTRPTDSGGRPSGSRPRRGSGPAARCCPCLPPGPGRQWAYGGDGPGEASGKERPCRSGPSPRSRTGRAAVRTGHGRVRHGLLLGPLRAGPIGRRRLRPLRADRARRPLPDPGRRPGPDADHADRAAAGHGADGPRHRSRRDDGLRRRGDAGGRIRHLLRLRVRTGRGGRGPGAAALLRARVLPAVRAGHPSAAPRRPAGRCRPAGPVRTAAPARPTRPAVSCTDRHRP